VTAAYHYRLPKLAFFALPRRTFPGFRACLHYHFLTAAVPVCHFPVHSTYDTVPVWVVRRSPAEGLPLPAFSFPSIHFFLCCLRWKACHLDAFVPVISAAPRWNGILLDLGSVRLYAPEQNSPFLLWVPLPYAGPLVPGYAALCLLFFCQVLCSGFRLPSFSALRFFHHLCLSCTCLLGSSTSPFYTFGMICSSLRSSPLLPFIFLPRLRFRV